MSKALLCCALVLPVLMSAIPMGNAATPDQVDNAVANGLAFLATQQNADGSFGPGAGGAYSLGATGEAILAFENEGHFPGGGTVYSANVEAGLDYLFLCAHILAISPQPAGNPDSNGNGMGVYFVGYDNEELYVTSIAAMAIVGSNLPDRMVTTGPLAGWTYQQVVTDLVDYSTFAQNDVASGNARGGWRYGPNFGSSDNSVSQWPVLSLIAAEQ